MLEREEISLEIIRVVPRIHLFVPEVMLTSGIIVLHSEKPPFCAKGVFVAVLPTARTIPSGLREVTMIIAPSTNCQPALPAKEKILWKESELVI